MVVAEKKLVVEKVYVTRNHKGLGSVRPSKVVGLVVDGDIYWLQHSFRAIDELTRVFHHLNIGLSPSEEWAMCDRYGECFMDKKITKISKDPTIVFDQNSSYVQRAVFTEEGSLFWSVGALRAHFPDTDWYYRDN